MQVIEFEGCEAVRELRFRQLSTVRDHPCAYPGTCKSFDGSLRFNRAQVGRGQLVLRKNDLTTLGANMWTNASFVDIADFEPRTTVKPSLPFRSVQRPRFSQP